MRELWGEAQMVEGNSSEEDINIDGGTGQTSYKTKFISRCTYL